MDQGLVEQRVLSARLAMTSLFLEDGMFGVEVGAGSRPFPVPPNLTVSYGDIRDADLLNKYFNGASTVGGDARFDAQTMEGFAACSLDFVLSGHVVEHLEDPVGAVAHTINVLKDGGLFIFAIPDMRFTFDRNRPETSVEHVFQDYRDGGISTRRQAYFEHLTFVHPVLTGQTLSDEDIEHQATESARRHKEFDIHFHAWTMEGFLEVLKATQRVCEFEILTAIPIENENIFVLRKGRRDSAT
jgi:SAM-dependent methyltransferase